MTNLFYEQLQEQSDGVDLKKYTIKELEKIKAEIEDLSFTSITLNAQIVRINIVDEIIDNHIKELKGEQE